MSSQNATTRTANSRANNIGTSKASELKKSQSTQNHHKEPPTNGSSTSASAGGVSVTAKAATPEQIRINSITNVNRTDDPDIVKKIRQVQDIVGEELLGRDEIALALHQNDYDLNRTVEFLLEGGRVDEDWITAGTTRKKPAAQSSNEGNEHANESAGDHHTSVNGRKRNQNRRSRDQPSNGNENQRPKSNKTRNGRDQPTRTIEDRFTANLDLKDSDEHSQQQPTSNGDDATAAGNNRVNNRPQRAPRGAPPRNNGTNGEDDNRRTKSGGRQHNPTSNNTNGTFRKTERTSGGPRLSNENRRSTGGTYNKVVNGSANNTQETSSEFVSETKTTINTETTVTVAAPNPSTTVNPVSPSIAAVVAGSLSGDNFRHMGTWSNENNDSNRNRRMMNNNRNGPGAGAAPPGGNRFNNQRQQGNQSQSNKLEVDEWDNEEEWQGDLTKPQIFTSSAQQKKETESSVPAQQIAQQNTARSDFTIDHFNAEEAAQKIKKAVGIGAPSTTSAPAESTNKTSNTAPAQQQPVTAAKSVPKMPSVKPPPPSTKIPKSAVIMPDGTTSTSSVSYLDVQFGVDFDTPSFNKSNTTQQETKPVSQPTQATSQVKPQPTQFPSGQISATSNTQSQSASQVSQAKPQTSSVTNKDNFVNKIDQLNSIKSSSNQQQQTNKPPQMLSDSHKSSTNSSGFPNHTPATNLNALKSNILQQQQQQRQFTQNQLNQLNNKDNVNAAHLNISPQNNKPNTNSQQQQQQVLNQLQQSLNQQSLGNSNSNQSSSNGSNSTNNMIAAAAAAASAASKQNPTALAPPPGVNMVNPNNQYLIGFPFNQNFPYFDQSQIDSSLMQVYSHLATAAMPPPGVGNSTAPPTGAQYSISDNKFPRNDSATSNSQLNLNPTPTSQLSAAGQQQPINLIPNLNNFPFFFPNYAYPNLYLPMHNGNQANQQQFQNKQPGYNFTNNGDYEQAAKDYGSYNAPSQMKTSSSNLSNVSDLNNVTGPYSKSVDKTNQASYHASTPPNFANSLLNQPPLSHAAAAPGGTSAAPTQFAYMMGTPGTGAGTNMVHPGIQDNLNSRNIGNSNNLKNMSKSSYQNNSWGQ